MHAQIDNPGMACAGHFSRLQFCLHKTSSRPSTNLLSSLLLEVNTINQEMYSQPTRLLHRKLP